MVGGPSIILTRKAVVDETFIRNSRNNCKSIVGIDASQLHPSSMCQDCTGDGNMTQNLIRLNINKTNTETLRTWL